MWDLFIAKKEKESLKTLEFEMLRIIQLNKLLVFSSFPHFQLSIE